MFAPAHHLPKNALRHRAAAYISGANKEDVIHEARRIVGEEDKDVPEASQRMQAIGRPRPNAFRGDSVLRFETSRSYISELGKRPAPQRCTCGILSACLVADRLSAGSGAGDGGNSARAGGRA